MKNYLSSRSGILISVGLLVFIDSIGQGLVFPTLPALFTSVDDGLMISSNDYNVNFLYGISIALFPLANLFGMPILGSMSDKIGRKKILMFGLYGLMLGYILSILSLITHSVWLFLIARCISGFSSGTYSACNAAVMDASSTSEEKINGLKYLTLSSVSGFILGPSFSILVSEKISIITLSMPFIIALSLCMFNSILLFLLYPELEHNEALKENNVQVKNNFCFSDILVSMRFIFNQNFGYLLCGYFLFNVGFQVFLQSQSMYLAIAYGYSVNQMGIFFSCMALAMVFSMFIIQPRIYQFCNMKNQIKSGLVIMGFVLINHMLFSMLLNDLCLYKSLITWIASFLFYLSVPFVTLNMTKIFSDKISNNMQGNFMGALGQISSASSVFAALMLSVLLYIDKNLSAGIGGIIILISFVLISTNLVSLKN